jgi:hypothetical protein
MENSQPMRHDPHEAFIRQLINPGTVLYQQRRALFLKESGCHMKGVPPGKGIHATNQPRLVLQKNFQDVLVTFSDSQKNGREVLLVQASGIGFAMQHKGLNQVLVTVLTGPMKRRIA